MKISYQPDVVGVGRLFVVILEVAKDHPEIDVGIDANVELLDRTPLPAKTTSRKFFFRAKTATEKATVTFAGQGTEKTVDFQIWSFEQFREFRTLKKVQLPRRWPLGRMLPELKTAQTITSEKVKKQLAGQGARSHWLEIDDALIWDLQPDSTIPRWHWVSVKNGGPVHGTKIYEKVPFYPWLNGNRQRLRSYRAPIPYDWKIVCPVGGEAYPSNDFANGDFTSGEFPDSGIAGPYTDKEGKKFGFIAELAQAYCHQMLRVPIECADDYLRTGDLRYVHKSLVGFSRLAVEFSYLATMTQHRHRNNRGQVDRVGQGRFDEGPFLVRSGFTVYPIDLPGYQCRISEAYDKIWPAIDKSAETVIPFLKAKGFDLENGEDLRRFIEENLMAVWMQGAIDGATMSNPPFHQWGLARMMEMLNYEGSRDFLDWLYDGNGKMRTFVYNDFFRDGAPYESTGGYNGMHVVAMAPIVESVEHLKEMRPELFADGHFSSFTEGQRYRSVFDFSMNTINIGNTYPRVGDDGSFPEYQKKSPKTFQNGGVGAFEHAYKMFREPKFAWALAHTSHWRPSNTFSYDRAEITAQASSWADDWNDRSRLSDGYGLAMLRSGAGTARRSLWMLYGRPRGHTHDDMLHMGLDAFQSEILGHLGYPRNWNYWTKAWQTQNTAKQIPFLSMTATPQIFADAGVLHVAEALACGFEDNIGAGEANQTLVGNTQRRTLALVDVDEEEFYCLDIQHLRGGREHWWSLHVQEDDGFTTSGLELVSQKGGTLAGEKVEYGDEKWLAENGCSKSIYGYHGSMFGFAHLYNVKRAPANSLWSADWILRDAEGLHFRLTGLENSEVEVAVCDGKSAAGSSPYEMKWVTMSSKGVDGHDTRFVTLMEMYREKPVIRSVRRLDLTGGPGEALALEIRHKKGRDVLFYSETGEGEWKTADNLAFAGRFGLWREGKDGNFSDISLIDGTTISRNGQGLVLPLRENRATIAATDHPNNTLTLDRALSAPESLIGQVVFITNPRRRLGLTVESACNRDGKTVLSLEFDPCVGIGRVTGHQGNKILTDTPFTLAGNRYYEGAYIVSADAGSEHRILGLRSGGYILLEPTDTLDTAVLPTEFPQGTWFKLYDYAAGDRVEIPAVASIKK